MRTARQLLRLALGRRLPTIEGRLDVAGVDDEVVIRRDRFGIPHVTATNDEDAAFGLGFCLGQDRTFQLETLLRVVRGTFAELVGHGGVAVDRLSRRVGFRRDADAQLAASEPATRRWIEAHVRGLNAGATTGRPRRPHELALLRARPTPWAPADVVGVWRLVAFLLAPTWNIELVRLRMARRDGVRAVSRLDVSYPADGPVTSPPGGRAGRLVDRLADDLERFADRVGVGGGSNAWVLAGSRTAHGRPLLACDAHLAPTVPSHWYLAHLRTPEWAVAGAAFVGLATLPVGHDGRAAWGITAAMVDNADLVLEQCDGDRVRRGHDWVPCKRVIERIAVRGGDTVEEEVLLTPTGPVVTPALDDDDGSCVISLRATWLGAHPLDVVRMHTVGDLDGLRRRCRSWAGAAVNVLWADRDGTIGWQLIGRPPVRADDGGTMPAWGDDGRGAGRGDGLLPFDELPWERDPAAGYLVSANNPPTAEGAERLGRDWLDGYRAARLEELLAARHDWDVAGLQGIQLDVTTPLWRDLASAVLGAPVTDAAGRVGQHLLARWDGSVAGDSPAASVFELLVAALYRRVVSAQAPRTTRLALGAGLTALTPRNYFPKRRSTLLATLLRDQPDGWLDRPWPDEVAAALSSAVRDLQARFGDDPDGWRWGRVRPLVLRHVLGARPPLDRVFQLGPFPAGGDHDTPSQHGVDPADPTRPPGVHPSLRAVIDPGAPHESRFALPGGQSGNPASPHYTDQLPAYSNGRGIPIAWRDDEVERATVARLRLDPVRDPPTGRPGRARRTRPVPYP